MLSFSISVRDVSVRDVDVGQQIGVGGWRGGARGFDRAFDQRRHLGVDRVELGRFEQGRLADPAAEMLQAVALLAQPPDFVLAAVELRVARMVAIEAAGVDLDGARTAAGAGAFDRLARRLVDREEIVAADLDRGQAEARRRGRRCRGCRQRRRPRCPRRTGCSRTRRSPAASAPPPNSSPRTWCPGSSRRRR